VSDAPKPPRPPPNAEALLEVFKRVVPSEFFRALADRGDGQPTDAFSTFRALARMMEVVARAGTRSVQARYFLPSAYQRSQPATSARAAVGEVVLSRVGDASQALDIRPGRMVLRAPSGRLYRNLRRVLWEPGDRAPRVAAFACEVQGSAGNCDLFTDADGKLPLRIVSADDQARGRAAPGGSILAGVGTSTVQDSGRPDLFDAQDVGLYVRVNAASVPGNVGALRRIVGFDSPDTEIPVGSGYYPRRVFVDDTVRRNTVEVLQDDGGVFTDFYAEASDELGVGDVELLPASPAVGDAVWVGFTAPFSGVALRYDTPGEADWEVVWEFWDGSVWVPFQDLDDESNGLRAGGLRETTWEVPSSWATQASPAGSGLSLYFARARLDSIVSVAQTPAAGRVVCLVPEPLAAEQGSVQWSLLDFQEPSLGVHVESCEAFAGGRDDDLYVLGDERNVYQQPGEPDDVFRERAAGLEEVVAPTPLASVVNRALRPLGYRGRVRDVTIDTTPDQSLVGAGFTGLFFDAPPSLAPGIVGAFDLYAPGDVHPQHDWFVLQSAEEAYGFFIVEVPYLGEGDFGMFFDEGPLYWDETVQVYYGSSFGGFLDGFPVVGNATYSAIYSSLESAKAGGVGFALIRRRRLTAPGAC